MSITIERFETSNEVLSWLIETKALLEHRPLLPVPLPRWWSE